MRKRRFHRRGRYHGKGRHHTKRLKSYGASRGGIRM